MALLSFNPVEENQKNIQGMIYEGFGEPEPPTDGSKALTSLPVNLPDLTTDEIHVLHSTNTSWLVYAAYQETLFKSEMVAYQSQLEAFLATSYLSSDGKTVADRNQQKLLSPEVLDLKEKIIRCNSLYLLHGITRERLEAYNNVLSRRLSTIQSERNSYGGS